MTEGFADRVARAVSATGPMCAGIDPMPDLLARWGLEDTPEGLRTFGLRCVEAFVGVVPVVKPQVAFFERMGSAGLAVLEEVLAACRDAGLLAIADAKRGDIGSTMEAYARAWLDPTSPLAADAMTAVAYMGLDALRPALDLASATGRGVLVVARSSNPEGRPLQEARTAPDDGPGPGPSVEDMVLRGIASLNRGGLPVPGTVGAVVGATLGPSEFDLAGLGGVILAPGVGFQGGTAEDVGRLFAGCPAGTVLPSVSRSLLGAGPTTATLRDEAARQCEALRRALD
ncbi:MAG: orotidine-5'-phosphate decarboxylase [Acidimicrobiales bacterium]|jgi:orotidine-5'-phosphate decarboxylase